MKRLGILLPSSGTVQEVDFYRRVPAGVSVHSARMRLTRATEDDEVRMLDTHTMPAAEDLATIRPDVVVFSCTSAGALRGRAYDASLCADIGRVTGAPVVSTLTAVGDALRGAAARSVALVTPYPEPITAHVRASLEAEGFRITVAAGLGLADSLEIAAVDPADIQRFAVETFRRAPAEAVCLACCTFRAYDAREAIQRELGVPVVTSNQAALSAALGLLQISMPPGYRQ
jgi:maleate isomerase